MGGHCVSGSLLLRNNLAGAKHGHMSRNEPVFRAFPMVVPLDVKFDYSSDIELHSLVLSQQAVSMNEKIPCKSVRIDEPPRALERADVSAQPLANGITRT